jgi:nucleotide-binding universal stress UspA family protein
MKEHRIIIAYDHSLGADGALQDLRCAGLRQHARALLITAEVARPVSAMAAGGEDDHELSIEHEHERMAAIAKEGAAELQNIYPEWDVSADTFPGPADEAILAAADRFGADLIVIGWNDRSPKERLWHPSVAMSVLRSAHCTVRIGRRPPDCHNEPKRVIIGIDGSENSRAAVEAVLERRWPSGTTVQVVAAIKAPFMEHTMAALMLPESERERLEERRRELREETAHAVARLDRAGLNAAGNIRVGDPLQLLLDAEQSWRAGSIFLGASGAYGNGASYIASIAFTVAERARCSVEIVRN